MQGVTHGAMVAGVSSSVVAAWMRQRVLQEYDPEMERPSLETRIRDRMPLVAAGVGFTGLSTLVAYSFDTIELSILANPDDPRPIHQQIENHRMLHSLPYMGGAIGAAHLIRLEAARFGRWIASNLNQPDQAEAIVDALEDLTDWLIDSIGSGIIGHLFGDLPTDGRGGTALQLLKPITNRNFSLRWGLHSSKSLNKHLTTAGMILTGAAWSFSCIHLLSWEPPEQKIREYIQRINQCESYEEAVQMVYHDLERLLQQFLAPGQQSIWQLSLFNRSSQDIHESDPDTWFQLNIETGPALGLDSLDRQSLVQTGALPEEAIACLDAESIYSQTHRGWDSTPLESEIESRLYSELFETSEEEGTQLEEERFKGNRIKSDISEEDGVQSLRTDESDLTSLFDESQEDAGGDEDVILSDLGIDNTVRLP